MPYARNGADDASSRAEESPGPAAPSFVYLRGGASGRISLWLALLLTLPALAPLAAPGYFFNAHDAHHSVFFLVEFDQAIRDGVLWPVWGPDHAIGFGYPLWLLYAPLAYYVAELFHLLGLGFTAAVKATWAVSFLAGAWGMHRLARRWWGPSAGLLAALAFTYAPYHLVQIYVRAALAEFAALACLPWVLLAFDALWDDPRPARSAVAALSLAALLLTHTVSALVFAPLVGGFLLVKLVAFRSSDHTRSRQRPGSWLGLRARPLLWTGGALGLGGLLAAIFLLPMLLERSYIVEAQWVADTYNYTRHFVYPHQLFSPTWGAGYSVPGPGDGMSFQLGVLPLLGAMLGVAGIFVRDREQDAEGRGRSLESLFLLVASLTAALAMTPAARPLWDALPLVGLIQFPWRLLAVTTVTLALLSGRAALWLDRPDDEPAALFRKSASPYVYVLALMFVLASFPYTRPELAPVRLQDETPLAVIEFETAHPDMRGMTRWSERMPADADSPLLAQYQAAWDAPSSLRLARAAIVTGQGAILEQSSAAASASARVRAETEIRLRFYIYYFPGWMATVDGRSVELSPDPPNGLIGLTLPPGEHEVRLRFGSTPPRLAGAVLSSAALAGVLALFAAGRSRKAASANSFSP